MAIVDLGVGTFQPAAGDKFTILTAEEEVARIFATVNLPLLTSGLAGNIDYRPTSVELRAALAGEYSNNGQVEQADLDLVLLNWGADVDFPGLPPEWIDQRPADGLIDQAELDAVLLNWGNSTPSGSASAAVPEPIAWVLAASLLVSAGIGAD